MAIARSSSGYPKIKLKKEAKIKRAMAKILEGKRKKSFEKTLKKEKGWVLRESDEFKELKEDLDDIRTHIRLIKDGKNIEASKYVLNTYMKKTKRQAKWVSRVEYRLHRFRILLDSKLAMVIGFISPELRSKIDKIKEEIDINEGNFLKIVSWTSGTLPKALEAVQFKAYEDPRLSSKENPAWIEVEGLASQAEYFLNGLLAAVKELEKWSKDIRKSVPSWEREYSKAI